MATPDSEAMLYWAHELPDIVCRYMNVKSSCEHRKIKNMCLVYMRGAFIYKLFRKTCFTSLCLLIRNGGETEGNYGSDGVDTKYQ